MPARVCGNGVVKRLFYSHRRGRPLEERDETDASETPTAPNTKSPKLEKRRFCACGTANDRAVPLGDSITAHAVGDQIDDPLYRATDGALTVLDPEHDKHRHLAV